MDNTYEFTINPVIDLSEQNISKEANAIIVALFQDYFATEEQKEKIKEILKLNEKKVEQEKRDLYNPDDIFKKSQSIEEAKEIKNIENNNENLPIEVKKETCQYDQYQEIWNTNVSLNDPMLVDGTLMVHDDDSSETFGKSINRDSFEIITTVDNKNVP